MSERFPSLSSLRDGLRFRCCQSREKEIRQCVVQRENVTFFHNVELSLPSQGLLKCQHGKHVLILCNKDLLHRNLFHKRVNSMGSETFTELTYHFKAKQHALQPVNLLSQFPDEPNVGVLHENQRLHYIWIKRRSSPSNAKQPLTSLTRGLLTMFLAWAA